MQRRRRVLCWINIWNKDKDIFFGQIRISLLCVLKKLVPLSLLFVKHPFSKDRLILLLSSIDSVYLSVLNRCIRSLCLPLPSTTELQRAYFEVLCLGLYSERRLEPRSLWLCSRAAANPLCPAAKLRVMTSLANASVMCTPAVFPCIVRPMHKIRVTMSTTTHLIGFSDR